MSSRPVPHLRVTGLGEAHPVTLWSWRLGMQQGSMPKRQSMRRPANSPTPLTRHSHYHGDKLSRVALPSELVECHCSCGIKDIAEGGNMAPILPGGWR